MAPARSSSRVADVATGIGWGVAEVEDTLNDAAGSVLENDFGKEAREAVGNAVISDRARIRWVQRSATWLLRRVGLPVRLLDNSVESRQDEEQKELERDVEHGAK